MDTPQVQRLRRLKQLGTADFVYFNVNHNRFEHSCGVAHLAERLCRHLKTRQPNLGITEKDELCLKLAGLCHDIGHGPFSHVYDGLFLKELQKRLTQEPELLKHYTDAPPLPQDWKHEHASLMMLDAALESLGLAIDMDNLDQPLKQIGDGVAAESMRVYSPSSEYDNEASSSSLILTSRDFCFIKECILGGPLPVAATHSRFLSPIESGFIGRPDRRYEFLYDIVANRHSGLDVDKMDYYARDSRRAFGEAGSIDSRNIDEAVVAWGDCPTRSHCFQCKLRSSAGDHRHLMICYPDKMEPETNEFFRKRFKLHSKVYSHKASKASTFMVCDILAKADPYFRVKTTRENDKASLKDGNDGMPSTLPISRAMLHPKAYLHLDDGVIDQIVATTSPELKDARQLIERLRERNFYKCADSKPLDVDNSRHQAVWDMKETDIQKEILMVGGTHQAEDNGESITLVAEDFIVEKSKMNHGKGVSDPVLFLRFLPKDELRKLTRPVDQLPFAQKIEGDSANKPKAFERRSIRVYCRSEQKLDLLRHVFSVWKQELDSEMQFTVLEENGHRSEEESYDEPVALTQDSDTMLSPGRVHDDRDARDYKSPVPSFGWRGEHDNRASSAPHLSPL